MYSSGTNKYDIEIENEFMACRIYWARVVSSEHEALFTQYTKHTFFEVEYALNGRIGMLLDHDKHVYVEESDFIVIPPDTYHQIVDGDQVGSRFIMAFSLHLKDEKLSGAFKRLQAPTPYHESPGLRALLTHILNKKYRTDTIRRRLLTSLLESFLMEMLEIVLYTKDPHTDAEKAAEEKKEIFAKLYALIREHNGIGLQVSDLAHRFCISERHLNRIVYAETGKSVKELINHEKLKKIEELTVSSALSLGEISELCGFSDEYAMNKFFKRYNLITLSDFRKISKKQV